jgi:hypothetical protein
MKHYPDYPHMPKELGRQIKDYKNKVSEWNKKHPKTTVTELFANRFNKYRSTRVLDDAGRLVSSTLTDLGPKPLQGWTIQFHSKDRVQVVRFKEYDELREFVAENDLNS